MAQNLDRQIEAIGEIDMLLQDKVYGANRTERRALAASASYIREGGTFRGRVQGPVLRRDRH